MQRHLLAAWRRGDGLVVAALTLLALALRAAMVDQTVVGDELFLWEIVDDRGLAGVLEEVHDTESTPPLHFVLAWASTVIGGDDLHWIRLPSVVLGAATVPLVYVLGRRLADRPAALVAAALFAIVPFEIFYGTEGRAYATLAFFCALSTLSLVELVRTDRRRWGALLAVATAAAMYTHYTAVFVLAAQLAWALWYHRDRARRVLMAYAAAAISYIPWIPSYLVQNEDSAANRIEALYPLNLSSYLRGVGQAWLGHPGVGLREIPGVAGGVLIAGGLLGASAAAVRRGGGRLGPNAVLVLLLVVATPLGALLYSLGPSSIFLPRNLTASTPAAVLATGMLIAAARRPLVVAVAAAAVLLGVGIGTVRTLQPEHQRPDFQGVARDLDRIAPPEAPVLEATVVTGPIGRQLGHWFERPHRYLTAGTSPEEIAALGHRSGTLYVVHYPGIEPLLGSILPDGFRLREVKVYPGALEVVRRTYESTRGEGAPGG